MNSPLLRLRGFSGIIFTISFCLMMGGNPGSASAVEWVTSGSDIYNANTGNVGIGTTVPTYKLDVSGGDIRVAGVRPRVRIRNTNAGGTTWQIVSGDTGAEGHFGIYSADAGTYRLVIDDGGKIGIGKLTPEYRLDVNGSLRVSAAHPRFRIQNTNTGGTTWQLASGEAGAEDFFGIYSDAATAYRLAIDGNGNVGVGTTGPGVRLEVKSTITSSSDDNSEFTSIESTNGQNALWFSSTQPLKIGIAATKGGGSFSEKMRIDTEGNVGIGTVSPAGSVHIKSTSGHIVLEDADEGGSLRLERDGGGLNVDLVSSNLNLFRISDNGNVGIGTTDPGIYKLNVNGDALRGCAKVS